MRLTCYLSSVAMTGSGQSRRVEQAEVRRLVRETLAELKPHEHEVIELSVRHNLDEAELAAVLDVSWSRAHALASGPASTWERPSVRCSSRARDGSPVRSWLPCWPTGTGG